MADAASIAAGPSIAQLPPAQRAAATTAVGIVNTLYEPCSGPEHPTLKRVGSKASGAMQAVKLIRGVGIHGAERDFEQYRQVAFLLLCLQEPSCFSPKCTDVSNASGDLPLMFTVLAYLFPDNVPRPDILLVEGADLLAVFEPFERSLADRIRSGELVSAETIRIILVQLLVGLDYLHQNSILHGRISPFTLLEVAPNRFKISDLDRALAPPSFVSTLMMNDPLWTLSYFPPELLLSLGRAGPAVDIWAVGCLTIELWTSMRPFHVEPGDCLASIAGKMARCSAFPEPGDSVDMDLAEAIDPAS